LADYSSLLFELASEDRLNILLLLKRNPLKLSHISAKLDFTVQETSRNIARLSDAGLIKKDVEGLYHLTGYGEETLNLLSGFRFLFKNREYFQNHTLAALPPRFRSSIAILESSDFVNDIMLTFHNVELMITKANEHVWILSDQILASTLPYLEKAIDRNVQFHLILPSDYALPESISPLITSPNFRKAVRSGLVDVRSIPKIEAFLCVSENELSALSFPTSQGKLEYTAFKTTNKTIIEWSEALFLHYWNQACAQAPQQLNPI